MNLRVSGKNIDVGDAFRAHVQERIAAAVEKYFDGGYSGQVTLERERPGFRSDCTIHLDSGVTLHAEGVAAEAHQSFDQAAERIEKRLRRYKRRLKEHHQGGRRQDAVPAASTVFEAPDAEAEITADYNPTVIAEETTTLATLAVKDAVIAMDLGDLPVIVFRNAGHGGINVVYRRTDGHIGWIDPSLSTASQNNGR
jgi:ribosomal subunit interface protein